MTAYVRGFLFASLFLSTYAILQCESPDADGASCQTLETDSASNGAGDASELLQTAVNVQALMPDAAAGSKTEADAMLTDDGSPADTVKDFCDIGGIAKMHGHVGANGSVIRGDQEVLKDRIVNDVAKELKDNSVDQMVKDIFSFYICVRWVPDEVFWKVAEEELAAEILQSVVQKSQGTIQVIGELYQNFKFMPLLCSKNLKVYETSSDIDNTYFTEFREKVTLLATEVTDLAKSQVWSKLKKADEIFCGGDRMNSKTCNAAHSVKDFLNRATKWMGSWGANFDTKQDRWKLMEDIFRSFKYHPSDKAWNTDFKSWKQVFPYHSFVAKPQGADSSHSPTSSQRFIVCFGKRVASELHRRPRGDHIITDQNNVGCHGWWDATHISTMLQRTVALWKMPTCDIAEMSYHMKKAILLQFMKMNEQLFDALPSMVADEELSTQGKLDEAKQGPPPFNVKSVTIGSTTYFDQTRVAATKEIKYKGASRFPCYWYCKDIIKKGHAGTIIVSKTGSAARATVKWDQDKTRLADVSAFEVMPQEYGVPVKGVLDTVQGWAAQGVASVSGFMNSLWGGHYANLAKMMSGSVAKWVVCPIRGNISLADLDKNLGTEDVVFREFVKEAYAKWTGYKAKVPGEQCAKEDQFLNAPKFPGCQVCEISQLHVDFPEASYAKPVKGKPGKKDEFMCPVVPPLDPAEQLDIFKSKGGQCLLHMTENQNRQFQWHYNGHHPARIQNVPKPNTPQPQYELVKLLDIGSSPGPKQISYGRTCTIEEQNANPRFCGLHLFANPWDKLDDMAKKVSQWLKGAAGMPVGAVSGLITNVQEVFKAKGANGTALVINEQVWNSLMGIGRYANSVAQSAANQIVYDMKGDDKRHARLEAELFGMKHGGDFLHSMSYQKHIGANNRSSNARQRYRRYAVICPCKNFDPGMELAVKWQWSEVALRAFREGLKHNDKLLEADSAIVRLRAEARLFFRDNAQQTTNNTWFDYGASIDAGANPVQPKTVTCSKKGSWWQGYRCEPIDSCNLQRGVCQKVTKPPPPFTPWRMVWDKKLAEAFGGAPFGDQDLSELKALTVTLYCGAKKSFGSSGGPNVKPSSLKSCMRNGIRTNAKLKAEKPWSLYFPDEVIVVAIFGTINDSKCISTNSVTENHVCSGSTKENNLDAHLGSKEKSSTGGKYNGMKTGKGYPQGCLKEVVLRPEDVLEVTNQLV